MKKNLGKADRIIRVVLVALLTAGALYWSSWVLAIVAAILALEALIGWCWLYKLIGISSRQAASDDEQSVREPESFDDVAKKAVADMNAGDAVLMDVRTGQERATGYAAGSMHWDLERMKSGQMPDIPKDKRIYTYCGFGGRAQQAAELLKDAGFSDVTSMGGLGDWRRAGGETESS
jgi:rhodanese-related sulfurtransferase